MKHQVLGAFLCGLVIPLALLALPPVYQRRTAQEAPEETGQPVESASDSGSIRVLDEAGQVRTMVLEDYLTGVLLAEMPVSFELEALKAQAVVARTYTCKRMDGGKHPEAVVCTRSDCCQGYTAASDFPDAQGVDKVRSAIAETAGQVLTYGGQLIDATYFSCSGGYTEDAVAVWGQDVPYLQAVESPGEEDAPRYAQQVTMSASEFAQRLGISAQGSPQSWFGRVEYTQGGGVDTLEVCGASFSGTRLRQLLGLRSTRFTLEVQGQSITISTLGFGHRVGMSQYGAQAMAEAGEAYDAILTHYYQGAVLTQMP